MTPNTREMDLMETLLPSPREIIPIAGNFVLGQPPMSVCAGKERTFAGERLIGVLDEVWGVNLPMREQIIDTPYALCIHKDPGYDFTLSKSTEETESLGDEGYCLEADADGVRIVAHTPRGLLWGVMTLRQLITRDDKQLIIRGVKIKDQPRYAWRGFMIDSGRAPNSLAKLKRIIRICSAFKLNLLLFREGDDELNAVRYVSNKLGTVNPYALSIEELAQLSDYARDYGIAFVPEVESLGHSTAKGAHYPELVGGGFEHVYEGVGTHIRKAHLAPCDRRTFDLLGSIYREWFSASRQPLIHLGLDEVQLPRETQARHFRQLLDVVSSCASEQGLEASPIVWSDAPETPELYKDRVIRCLWEYAGGKAIGFENEHLKEQGIVNLSTPGCREFVFMAGGSGSGHTPYAKSPYNKAFLNLASWAQWGETRQNFIGLLAVQWSGNMTDDWLPDYLAAADFGWKPPRGVPDPDALQARIAHHLSSLSDATNPKPEEVDRPAWDGIWLKGNQWDEEILTNTSHHPD